MPQPPANPPTMLSTVMGYTVGAGLVNPVTTTKQTTANVPFDQACTIIGVDVAIYDAVTGQATVSFPNLPKRSNSQNPLNPQQYNQNTLTVNPQDQLIFVVTPQSTNNPVAVEGYGVLKTGSAPGPFLGPETYYGFQATVSGAPGSNGLIIGMLFLNRGLS